MDDEISYLLKMPSEQILKAVLQEALSDLQISSDEEILIAGLREDLFSQTEKLPKFDTTSPLTKDELQLILIKQRALLRDIVAKTYERARADGIITTDEMAIYRALLHKVDQITADKISMFLDLDLETHEPHLLTFHQKVGQAFANLTATLIMDIFSERMIDYDQQPNLKEQHLENMINVFSSDRTNKDFIDRFSRSLKDLSILPIQKPTDILKNIEEVLKKY